MARRILQYENDAISVTFDSNLCIHSARCLQHLPEVFDVRRRKWVAVDSGSAGDIAEAVALCPSGALKYQRKDGGANEAPDAPAFALPLPNGPIYVRGEIEILDAEGGVLGHGARFALCRCGGSANKPFCDNTHRGNGFSAP